MPARPPDDTIATRFEDAGRAIGDLLLEAGYVPSEASVLRVFQRLYRRLTTNADDRPDLRTSLSEAFLRGVEESGYALPRWMQTAHWTRSILSFDL